MDLGIQDKTALVLSAGGGLGRAIAAALSKEGVKVALSDLDERALAESAALIQNSGGKVVSQTLDLADIPGASSLIDKINRELGAIDILVNIISGGPGLSRRASNVSPEVWTKQFNAMVLSMIHITDLILPGMRANHWGRIITSTSSGVLVPIANLGISNTLRSSLLAWSKTLAAEVASEGITVNIVVPGRIATKRVRQLDEARAAREGKTVAEIVALSSGSIPMRRYGNPSEYADVVAFLASAKASYITGATIRVDGGLIPSL